MDQVKQTIQAPTIKGALSKVGGKLPKFGTKKGKQNALYYGKETLRITAYNGYESYFF